MFHGFDVLPQSRLVLEDLRHAAVVSALPALVLLGLGRLGLELANLHQDPQEGEVTGFGFKYLGKMG